MLRAQNTTLDRKAGRNLQKDSHLWRSDAIYALLQAAASFNTLWNSGHHSKKSNPLKKKPSCFTSLTRRASPASRITLYLQSIKLNAAVYDRAVYEKSKSWVKSERMNLSEYWVSLCLYKFFHEDDIAGEEISRNEYEYKCGWVIFVLPLRRRWWTAIV